MQLALAKSLGKDGDDLKKWTLDGLKAFATYAYDEQNNTFRPMLANGTDLSGYALKRDGYYGKKGTVLKTYPAMNFFSPTPAPGRLNRIVPSGKSPAASRKARG